MRIVIRRMTYQRVFNYESLRFSGESAALAGLTTR
jgi:hypothetical protein